MTWPIVVGVDGSQESLAAADWAAVEAEGRQLPLHLLHSWTTQPHGLPIAQEARSKQRYGGQVLQRAEAELCHRHPGLTVTTELTRVPAARALPEHDDKATMLVLGARGHGDVNAFLHGEISRHVLGSAICPVVAVRTQGAHPLPGEDEIVVGLQQLGAHADALLAFAFTSAAVQEASVRAVHVRGDGERPAESGTKLTDVLAPWQDKFPTVPVITDGRPGPAAEVLLAAAANARLVVIGRRLHRAPMTWRLGSVAHAVLHHSTCPVAVVPHN